MSPNKSLMGKPMLPPDTEQADVTAIRLTSADAFNSDHNAPHLTWLGDRVCNTHSFFAKKNYQTGMTLILIDPK